MSDPAASPYRPDIDGLRAVAVLSVVLFHMAPAVLPGGFVGVDVFFVISGYLISRTMYQDLDAGRFTYLNFYARRARRILPALLIVLPAVMLLGAILLLGKELAELGRHAAAAAGFASNILLWRESGYFDDAATMKPLLHLWSLGVEEQFYLTWPVLLAVAHRRRWKVSALIGALAAASFAFCLRRSSRLGVDAFYLLPSRYWQLLSGCGLAYWEHAAPRRESGRADALSAAAAAIWLLALLSIRGTDFYPGWWALLPTAAAFLFIRAGAGAWLNRRVLSLSPLVWVGRISYPLYLWHWPLLSFAWIVERESPSLALRSALVAASFALAWLTWRLVELPLRASAAGTFAGRGTERTFVLAGAAGLLCIGILGGVTTRLGGFPGRYKKLEAASASIAWPRNEGTKNCRRRYGLPKGLYCHASSVSPRLIVWGDSHANHLMPGLLADQAPDEFPLVQIGKARCAALLDVEMDYDGVPTGCLEANELVRGVIGADLKGARLAIVSARVPHFFEPGVGERWSFVSRRPEDGGLSPRDLFKAGSSRAIAFLEGQGLPVVFALDVPQLGFDPATCSAMRPFFPADGVRGSCGVARERVDADQREYRRVIEELRLAHPRLRVFDPVPLLCDDKFCSAVRDGRLLYRDSSHLSVEGSKLVARPLVELLREIERR